MSTRHLAHLRENSRGDSPGRLGIWQGKDSSASLGKHILNHVSRYQGKKWYGRNTSRGVSWISPMRPYDYWLYIIRTRHELLGIIRGLCVVNVRTLGVVVLANRRTCHKLIINNCNVLLGIRTKIWSQVTAYKCVYNCILLHYSLAEYTKSIKKMSKSKVPERTCNSLDQFMSSVESH